jgi:uncharacterized protein YgbK (DUF1537 family)
MELSDYKSYCEITIGQGFGALMIDAVSQDQLTHIGAWLDAMVEDKPLFSVGSSGIEMALGQYWAKNPQTTWPSLKSAEALLVLSGSCSPITGRQIEHAITQGFEEIIIDLDDASYHSDVIDTVIQKLDAGISVIVHTNGTRTPLASLPAAALGTALGNIALRVLHKKSLQRILIAGGDTSSYVARALGIIAVEMLAPLTPGAPVCKAYSNDEHVQGIELVFKGGQLGTEDYFSIVRNAQID